RRLVPILDDLNHVVAHDDHALIQDSLPPLIDFAVADPAHFTAQLVAPGLQMAFDEVLQPLQPAVELLAAVPGDAHPIPGGLPLTTPTFRISRFTVLAGRIIHLGELFQNGLVRLRERPVEAELPLETRVVTHD